MAQKTYLIGLFLAATALERYMSRWDTQILANDLTGEQIAAFADCLQCVQSLIALFRPSPPTP